MRLRAVRGPFGPLARMETVGNPSKAASNPSQIPQASCAWTRCNKGRRPPSRKRLYHRASWSDDSGTEPTTRQNMREATCGRRSMMEKAPG
eukprot:scaffold320_cov335-Pavlova_lutheri.AAC.28